MVRTVSANARQSARGGGVRDEVLPRRMWWKARLDSPQWILDKYPTRTRSTGPSDDRELQVRPRLLLRVRPHGWKRRIWRCSAASSRERSARLTGVSKASAVRTSKPGKDGAGSGRETKVNEQSTTGTATKAIKGRSSWQMAPISPVGSRRVSRWKLGVTSAGRKDTTGPTEYPRDLKVRTSTGTGGVADEDQKPVAPRGSCTEPTVTPRKGTAPDQGGRRRGSRCTPPSWGEGRGARVPGYVQRTSFTGSALNCRYRC
jgi:hypothetical protein